MPTASDSESAQTDGTLTINQQEQFQQLAGHYLGALEQLIHQQRRVAESSRTCQGEDDRRREIAIQLGTFVPREQGSRVFTCPDYGWTVVVKWPDTHLPADEPEIDIYNAGGFLLKETEVG